MRSYWSRVDAESNMDWCPHNGRHRETCRELQVRTKAELGFTQMQAKNTEVCSNHKKNQGRVLLQASKGAWPCEHLDFRLLDSTEL